MIRSSGQGEVGADRFASRAVAARRQPSELDDGEGSGGRVCVGLEVNVTCGSESDGTC